MGWGGGGAFWAPAAARVSRTCTAERQTSSVCCESCGGGEAAAAAATTFRDEPIPGDEPVTAGYRTATRSSGTPGEEEAEEVEVVVNEEVEVVEVGVMAAGHSPQRADSSRKALSGAAHAAALSARRGRRRAWSNATNWRRRGAAPLARSSVAVDVMQTR